MERSPRSPRWRSGYGTRDVFLDRWGRVEERTENDGPRRTDRERRTENDGPKTTDREGRQKSVVCVLASLTLFLGPSFSVRSSRPGLFGPVFYLTLPRPSQSARPGCALERSEVGPVP